MHVIMSRWSIAPLVLLAGPAMAQSPMAPTGTSAWVDQVRAATLRYQDQSAAAGDGYRRMGPDAPGMGQHWISLARVADISDPQRPPILEYATINGEVRLIGVGYARVLPQGTPLEATAFPAPLSAWRYHLGDISEDGLILTHADHPVVADITVPRLAILHAWVWQPNPNGLFATDNWTLPYLRLGLTAPKDPQPTPATLALALATGGEIYFHSVLRLRFQPRPSEALRTAGVLTRYASAIRATVNAGQPDTLLLADQWNALDLELRSACPTCNRAPHLLLSFPPDRGPLP